MYLLGKYVYNINEADIKRLLENEVKESITLDYKRQLNIADDKEKNRLEFLYDITAMYNSDGGCIIYGIEEKKDDKGKNTGYPAALFYQEIENRDKLEQQIHDIIRSNTDPAIVNVAIVFIEVDGVLLIILGVSKTLGLPSMVTFNEVNKFYKRNSSGKYGVGTFELNQMFMQNQALTEKAHHFKTQRIMDVRKAHAIMPLERQHSYFLHVIPYSFLNGKVIDLVTINFDQLEDSTYPIGFNINTSGNTGYNTGYNLDGFFTYRNIRDSGLITSYNQFFRNGIIESYCSLFYSKVDNGSDLQFFHGTDMIRDTIFSIRKALNVLTAFAIEPPYLVYISLFDLRHVTLLGGHGNILVGKFSRDEVSLPALVIDQIPETNGEIHEKLKPLLNIIWQAAGVKESPSKDEVFGQR